MDYTPITPFRRSIDAAVLKHQTVANGASRPVHANKWEVLRELGKARTEFGLSDRDITVLQALVSFHQATVLDESSGALIVYPSNKSICERLNGMPCSTMRRHLSNLVNSGFVIRRDSPNGKRYARKYGNEKVAFGFDLSPLDRRFAEICDAAEAIRAAEDRYQRMRASVSLMRRDLAGLAEYGRTLHPNLGLWDQYADLAILTARALRRKLDLTELSAMEKDLSVALNRARDLVDHGETENMSTSDAISEQHHQNSDKDSYDYEPETDHRENTNDTEETITGHAFETEEKAIHGNSPELPNIPLRLILETCQEFKTYVTDRVRHWHDLVRVADQIRPMMGVSPSAWEDAKQRIGPEEASVVLVAMLERFETIRSPGGYLRSLSAKAAEGAFSCGPMIMSLMRRGAA